MAILSTLGEKVLNFTMGLVGLQLGYVLSYSDNIKELEKEAKKLNDARTDMERKVDAARNNNEEIKETVKNWMREVDEITAKADKFFEEESRANIGCSLGSCPNLWLRCKLSREAKKMAAEVYQLNGEVGKFDGVSTHQMRPQGFGDSSMVREAFESRVLKMKEMMEALIDPAVHLIGLHGLGGVGKTTLAKQVAEKAQDEKLFDRVLVVEVKHNSIKEIQNQIADMVGLRFDLQSGSEIIRADRLRLRLEQEKSLLVVLDDLWERLDFKQVGIPSVDEPNTQRKFIFTSRNANLLYGPMNCERNIPVELFSEEEAWLLFKKMAEINEHSDNPNLVLKAKEVSQKCARLPLAIVAVATALKNNKRLVVWEDALQRLKSYSAQNRSLMEKVDSSIKLSYEFLKTMELKSTFLLSAMFSQDPFIKDLLMYAIGLGFLEDIRNMKEARNRLDALVCQLKQSSLLLDSYSEDHFTIHDVVRDVALSIAFERQHALVRRREKVDEWPNEDQLERCTAICLDESDIDELPEEFYGPKVEFFYLYSKDLKLSMPNNFFRGMPELKVLSLSQMTFSWLPSSIGLLKKLVTLSLHSCILGDITVVEHLKKLKILNLSYSRIEELPREVGQLSSLKILNLSCCYQLKVIPPNLLSNLKKLEELYMRQSFNQWEAEGINEGKERASLDEVKHLQKLSTLEIDIPNTSILPKDFVLESSLERYKISIGECVGDYFGYKFSRTLRLVANDNSNMEYGVFRLFEDVEDLYLRNLNGIASLYQSHFTAQTFCKLRAIKVSCCDKLKSLFLVSMAGALSKLERIEVSECKSLEEIVAFSDEENVVKGSTMNVIEFLQLRYLELKDLAAFTDFCNKVTFPNLETLHLTSINCQSIFMSKSSEIQISEIRESSQNPLPDRSFSNLKTLVVVDCKFLLILIPLYILKSLSNLEELTIKGCDLLEEVFDFGQFTNYEETHTCCLKRLILERLPKLKTVWGRGSQGVVIFSSLREVNASECESLENIFPVSIAKGLSQLEKLHISDCGIEGIVAKNEFPEPDAALVFPKLRKVDISNCNKLKIFLDEKVLRSLKNLEELEITGCDLLEVVFDFGQFTNYEETHTFCLKRLILERLPKLKTVWGRGSQGVVIFSSLREVNASECESLENIFPVSIAKGLNQLEELHISHCGIEGVVAKDEFSEPDATFVFPKLRKLKIGNCNKLKIFQSELPDTKYSLFLDEKVIPKLEELSLYGMHAKVMCQFREFHFLNVKFLSLSKIYDKEATFLYSLLHLLHGFPDLEELQLSDSFYEVIFSCSERPLDNDARKTILIGGMKLFKMKRLKHIWDRKCQVDHILQNLKTLYVFSCNKLINLGSSFVSLQNLTVLDVFYCDELINLLTPSTAGTLVQLTRLEISGCNKIEEIITDGEEDVEKEIVFKKLKRLKLDGLSSCKSFCCHSYNFKFPLLDDVIIGKCPKFRIFCPGDLTTPLLKGVKVLDEIRSWVAGALQKIGGVKVVDVHWQDNLNKTIQQLFDEKVLFKDQDVKIDEYPELIDIWNEKCVVSNPSFSNLTSLVVDKCAFLSNCVIPSYVLISLINLKKLEVRNCDSVEAVFDLEGIDIDKEAHTLQTICLSELELRQLPNLKCIWNKDPHIDHCFRHLSKMSAYECESLKYFSCIYSSRY